MIHSDIQFIHVYGKIYIINHDDPERRTHRRRNLFAKIIAQDAGLHLQSSHLTESPKAEVVGISAVLYKARERCCAHSPGIAPNSLNRRSNIRDEEALKTHCHTRVADGSLDSSS